MEFYTNINRIYSLPVLSNVTVNYMLKRTEIVSINIKRLRPFSEIWGQCFFANDKKPLTDFIIDSIYAEGAAWCNLISSLKL